jgi:hypothetical protein
LTGIAVRSKLRNLRDTDPIFWEELTLSDPEMLLPSENIPQAEDEHNNKLHNTDDSDVPIGAVVENIVADVAPRRYGIGIGGGFEAEAAAEIFDDTGKPAPDIDVEMGCGKHCKQPNRLYRDTTFWRHNDEDASDAEDL